MDFKPCILIPCYNHSVEFEKFLPRLLRATGTLKIFLIDDGSVPEEAQRLQAIADGNSTIQLIRLARNGGKGTAIKAGFEAAIRQGFTHALQIDADGQHDPDEIPLFLKRAGQNPEAGIFGAPVYDDSAPKARVYGRKITNFWLVIETFSLKMKDGLCGFRVYPLETVKKLLKKSFWSSRMGVDLHLLVELCWLHVPVIFVDIHVIYPEGGRSHLTPFKGNLAISLTHTQLVIRRIWRLLTFRI